MATYLYHTATDTETDLVAALTLLDGTSYVVQNRSDVTICYLEERLTGVNRIGVGAELDPGTFWEYVVDVTTPARVWCAQGQSAQLVVAALP